MVISPTPLKSFSRSPPSPWGLAGTIVTLTPTSRPASKALPVLIRYVEAAALAGWRAEPQRCAMPRGGARDFLVLAGARSAPQRPLGARLKIEILEDDSREFAPSAPNLIHFCRSPLSGGAIVAPHAWACNFSTCRRAPWQS
jgi:hypothetical protein